MSRERERDLVRRGDGLNVMSSKPVEKKILHAGRPGAKNPDFREGTKVSGDVIAAGAWWMFRQGRPGDMLL